MEVRELDRNRRFSAEKMTKINLFETPRFFLDQYCLESGQAQKLHRHAENDKVYIVLEGQGRFQVGDEERVLGPHQAVLAPAGVDHGVVNPTPERLVLLTFMAPHPGWVEGKVSGGDQPEGKRAASMKEAGVGANDAGQRLQEFERLFSQFASCFDRVWNVIVRGEAGNLLREALENPDDLERAAALRREVESALRRLRQALEAK